MARVSHTPTGTKKSQTTWLPNGYRCDSGDSKGCPDYVSMQQSTGKWDDGWNRATHQGVCGALHDSCSMQIVSASISTHAYNFKQYDPVASVFGPVRKGMMCDTHREFLGTGKTEVWTQDQCEQNPRCYGVFGNVYPSINDRATWLCLFPAMCEDAMCLDYVLLKGEAWRDIGNTDDAPDFQRAPGKDNWDATKWYRFDGAIVANKPPATAYGNCGSNNGEWLAAKDTLTSTLPGANDGVVEYRLCRHSKSIPCRRDVGSAKVKNCGNGQFYVYQLPSAEPCSDPGCHVCTMPHDPTTAGKSPATTQPALTIPPQVVAATNADASASNATVVSASGRYAMITDAHGTCASHSLQPITTVRDCKRAFVELDLGAGPESGYIVTGNVTDPQGESWEWNPPGCYHHLEGDFTGPEFNPGGRVKCSKEERCLCATGAVHTTAGVPPQQCCAVARNPPNRTCPTDYAQYASAARTGGAAVVTAATMAADNGERNRDTGPMANAMNAMNGSDSYTRFRTGNSPGFTMNMTLNGPSSIKGVSIMVRRFPHSPHSSTRIATQIYAINGSTHVTLEMMQEACARVPNSTDMLEVVMGNVRDLFRPSRGNDWCDMLQSNTKHEFHTGSGWVVPLYNNHQLGGSGPLWPQKKGAANDRRQYLSFWGQRGPGRAAGGCCTLTYTDDASHTEGSSGWGRPFIINAIETTQGAGYSGIEISTSTDGGRVYTQQYARYEMFGDVEKGTATHKTPAADFEYGAFVVHRFPSVVDSATNVRVHFDLAYIQNDACFTLNSVIVNTKEKEAPTVDDAFDYGRMFLSVCNNGVHDSWLQKHSALPPGKSFRTTGACETKHISCTLIEGGSLWAVRAAKMTCKDGVVPDNEGNAITNTEGMSRDECEAACHAANGCNAFAWARAGDSCFLKKDFRLGAAGAWRWRGYNFDFCYKGPPTKYSVHSNRGCSSRNELFAGRATLTDCRARCTRQATCVSFEYFVVHPIYKTGYCQVSSSCTNDEANEAPHVYTETLHVKNKAGERTCTFPAVDVKVNYACTSTSGVVDGKSWSDDHTWAEVKKACQAKSYCLGLMWKKGNLGKQKYTDGGAFQMCRGFREGKRDSVVQDTSGNWDLILASCNHVSAAVPRFVCRSGAQIDKNDLGAFSLGYTKDSCEAACAANRECVSFDVSKGGECYLSSTRAGAVNGGGITSPPNGVSFMYCERTISDAPSCSAEANGWACVSSSGPFNTSNAVCSLTCCRGCGCTLKKAENAQNDDARVAVCEATDVQGAANYHMCAAPRITTSTVTTATTTTPTQPNSKTIAPTSNWGSFDSTSATKDTEEARDTESPAKGKVEEGTVGNSSIGNSTTRHTSKTTAQTPNKGSLDNRSSTTTLEGTAETGAESGEPASDGSVTAVVIVAVLLIVCGLVAGAAVCRRNSAHKASLANIPAECMTEVERRGSTYQQNPMFAASTAGSHQPQTQDLAQPAKGDVGQPRLHDGYLEVGGTGTAWLVPVAEEAANSIVVHQTTVSGRPELRALAGNVHAHGMERGATMAVHADASTPQRMPATRDATERRSGTQLLPSTSGYAADSSIRDGRASSNYAVPRAAAWSADYATVLTTPTTASHHGPPLATADAARSSASTVEAHYATTLTTPYETTVPSGYGRLLTTAGTYSQPSTGEHPEYDVLEQLPVVEHVVVLERPYEVEETTA